MGTSPSYLAFDGIAEERVPSVLRSSRSTTVSEYLIVAYQTAGGGELRDALSEVSRGDPDAEFTLLVPATHTQHLFTWTEGEAQALASERADAAAESLRASGLNLVNVVIADPDPFVAVTNHLTSKPSYAGIIVSTFPPRVSRWLRLDLPTKLEKRSGLPVTHVIVTPPETPHV
jgi:hypothetical protein